MQNVNWKEKLSSRKLWIGVALLIIGVVLCVTGDVENGLSLISLAAVSYLGAEALVDIARAIFNKEDNTNEQSK